MLDILRVAIAGPANALGHDFGKLHDIQLKVSAVVGQCSRDVTAAKVVALQR